MADNLVFDSFLLNKIISMVPKLELGSRVETTLIGHPPAFKKYTFNIRIRPISYNNEENDGKEPNDNKDNNVFLLSFELGYPNGRYDYSAISKKILDFQFRGEKFHLNNFQKNQESTIQITDENILHVRGDINVSVKLYPVDKDQLFRILEVTLNHHNKY